MATLRACASGLRSPYDLSTTSQIARVNPALVGSPASREAPAPSRKETRARRSANATPPSTKQELARCRPAVAHEHRSDGGMEPGEAACAGKARPTSFTRECVLMLSRIRHRARQVARLLEVHDTDAIPLELLRADPAATGRARRERGSMRPRRDRLAPRTRTSARPVERDAAARADFTLMTEDDFSAASMATRPTVSRCSSTASKFAPKTKSPADGRALKSERCPDSSINDDPSHHMVDLRGLEPLTPCMPCRCATSCATDPHCPGS